MFLELNITIIVTTVTNHHFEVAKVIFFHNIFKKTHKLLTAMEYLK